MKRLCILTFLSCLLPITAFSNTININVSYLTGDARTACEVILCLSSGSRPSECNAPIRRYFSIKAKKWHKTLAKRRAFLDLCPAANENAKMSALTTVIQNQEYACDAATLNSRTETKIKRFWRPKDDGGSYIKRWYKTQSYIPKFCEDLYNHEFTEYSQIKRPQYTCDKNKWYTASDWERGIEKVIVSSRWNSRTDTYVYKYKDVPINKNCWK